MCLMLLMVCYSVKMCDVSTVCISMFMYIEIDPSQCNYTTFLGAAVPEPDNLINNIQNMQLSGSGSNNNKYNNSIHNSNNANVNVSAGASGAGVGTRSNRPPSASLVK